VGASIGWLSRARVLPVASAVLVSERTYGMGVFSEQLRALAQSVVPPDQWSELASVMQQEPVDVGVVADLDDMIEGPSIRRLNSGRDGPGSLGIAGYGQGAYALEDREVFRGLHYCGSYLQNPNAVALMRPLVLDGAAHLEALLKRMTGRSKWHLARLARAPNVEARLGAECADRMRSYADINNAAKHPYGLELLGHMFSVRDGIFAYFTVRMLALSIYPEVRMATDWRHLGASQSDGQPSRQ
jgi:hypothetical protein